MTGEELFQEQCNEDTRHRQTLERALPPPGQINW